MDQVNQQEGEQTSGRRRRVWLDFSRRNVAISAAVLIGSALFLIIERFLLVEEELTGLLPIYGWYTLLYVALTLLAAFLFLVETDLPMPLRKGIGAALLLLVPLGAFYAVDIINSTRIFSFPTPRFFANYLCYLLVFALLYAITRRVWLTVLIGGFFFLFFGIANYFVVEYRGQPILPWDLQSVGTAMSVAGGYRLIPTRKMAVAMLAYFCLVAVSLKAAPTGRREVSRPVRVFERIAAMTVTLVLFVLLFPVNILSSMGVSVWAWNQKTSSEITGVTAGFFANVQYLMVEKPEGYSQSQVRALETSLNALEEPEALGSPAKMPTIIGIMNESFTDLESVGDMKFFPDNLPFLHRLQQRDDVIWGTAYSSVYGGNTCNSEYEFLTGNTTAFLPTGSKPYQQYVDCPQTALPSLLKQYGYACTAIHPGDRDAWQRDEAYPYLGFDKFIAAEDFTVDRYGEHGLTSDASCYRQVIWEYEHRDKDVPQFIFNVTIQNHGGYEVEDYPTTVRVQGHEGEFPQAEQYLSLTRKSDMALENLIDYFEQQDDPVVVIFFGDHWPNLEAEFVSLLLDKDLSSLTIEDMMREYQVPFFIWANYPLEGEHIDKVSLNYLSGLLLRAADLPGTVYTRFLEQLRADVPVITAEGTIDRDGNVYQNGQDTPFDEKLRRYDVLEYNNAFGNDQKVEEIFKIGD